jgi:type I restriction enzyme S subunit
MKEGWKYMKLGEVCEILNGFAFKSSNYVDCGIRIIRITNVQKGIIVDNSPKYYPLSEESNLNKYILKKNDLLMSLTGNVGRVGLLPTGLTPAALNQRVACIRMKNDNLSKTFLFHYLNSNSFEQLCIENASGAAQLNLSTVWLSNVQIPVPPISDQQRIVSYLDAEFAKIEALKANAEKQLQAAKDLFQAALKELLTPKEGWKMKTIDSLQTDMYRGSGITREQIRLEGVPCVRYGEIYTTYNYWFEECVSHTDEQIINSKKYFEHGDILFAITGESVEDIGKSIAYLGHNKCLAGGDIIVMKHNQNPKYLAYALSTPDAIAQKGFGKTKLKVVHTNAPSLKAIVLPIPTLPEQQRIADRLDALSANVKALQTNYTETITLCNDLKQALLKKVFEEDG